MKQLQNQTIDKDFWDDNIKAQSILKKISVIESEMEFRKSINDKYEECQLYIELIAEGESINQECIESLYSFKKLLNRLETKNLLNEQDDHRGAILNIHPGAGGTESQDWAKMLFRLYKRWCERNNYKITLLDFQDGDEGGIKDVSFEISGDYAYGNLKSERGVHRLVRISPFDSNSRRHTSFASVFIYPQVTEDIEIEINDKDIRIDTYRASGAGGQHINKTDSAVRITHIESGIVVQCQNQRSQLKNKNSALKLLKAKLYQKKIDDIALKQEKLEVQKKDISWGSQIRSYIFHPYTLVKDHRTKEESSNIQSIMDGEIDQFIRSYLIFSMENKNAK